MHYEKIDLSNEAVANLYGTLQQLSIHSQENKSFTLYNFLMFNSFLLVGWATLFSQAARWFDGAACTLICLIGLVASLAWESLGRDYANASDLFRSKLVESERFLPLIWPRSSEAREEQIGEKGKGAWWPFSKTGVRSRHLLIYTPRILAGSYILFILLSWVRVIKT